MTADACLAFLWKGDPPGVDYDPNNMVDGFLEGFTLEHVGIWPTAAYGGHSHGTRPCNAVLHNMMTVEAARIAYGCVEENGDFNYCHFYRHIVELIEDFASRSRRTITEGLEHNEDGRDVVRDDADESEPSSTCEGSSDLSRLCTQLAAHNAAAKTHTLDSVLPDPPPAQATMCASPPAPEHLPPPLRMPPPPAPVRPHPVPHLVSHPVVTVAEEFTSSKDTSTIFTSSQQHSTASSIPTNKGCIDN
ncbi:hypothetical protein M405DRAFT_816688 [Rhizopogon salebrosus TDB-379]|nr:hypothetical protein M405DRAFT_816688 [Rhizopogon salebrosus TDB-379]